MNTPSNRELRGVWRRRLFWGWVVASALVAAYVGIAGPITSHFGEGQPFVAFAVPALMFFMLATGLGWLVLLYFSHPRGTRVR
jgi:Na+-driven multidrug efflux pump